MTKLIRDKLPRKYNLKVEECKSDSKYRILLVTKLVEEVNEVYAEACRINPMLDATLSDILKAEDGVVNTAMPVGKPEFLIEELADVKEVFDTILDTYGIKLEEVVEYQKAKRLLNGGFSEGYILKEEK